MESREREPKGSCIFHAARVKQLPERIAKSDKHRGNGNCVNARKVMDSDGSGAYTQGPSTTYLYPANIGKVGHGLGYERVWSGGGEKGGPILGFPLKLF